MGPPKPTRKHPKIESALLAIAEVSRPGSAAFAEAARVQRVPLRGDKIRVRIESVGANTAAVKAAVAAVQ